MDLTPDLTDEQLTDKLEEVRLKYEERLTKVLFAVKEELERFAWFCSTIFRIDESESSILVSRDKAHTERDAAFDAQDIEITARILDSRYWEGNVRGGVAFAVDADTYNGESIGGYVPYNYTEMLWVPVTDEYQVEQRMKMIERVNPMSMVQLLRKWQKGRLPK